MLASGSVIKALLRADAVNRFSITLCPEIVGGGASQFEDGFPASGWAGTELATTDTGATRRRYNRAYRDN